MARRASRRAPGRLSTRSRSLCGLVAVAGALLAPLAAYGAFSAPASGSATGATGGLDAPAKPSAAAVGTARVDVGWHRAKLTDGSTSAQRYYLSRYHGAAFDGYACATSPTGTTIPDSAADGSGNFTCSDTGLTSAGPYSYTVTSVYRSWSAESVHSDPVSATLVGPLDHFLVTASSSTPTAGAADGLTVTAQDASNLTVTGYSGDHSLTFSGPGAIGGHSPTVTDKSGNAVTFGTPTTITFANGVASVSGGVNGVMTLFLAETIAVHVTDGTVGGTSTSLTVGPAAAASFTVGVATQSPAAGSAFAVTVTGLDPYGNVATGYSGPHGLDLSGPHTAPDGTHTPSWTGTNVSNTFAAGSVTIQTTLYDVETVALTAADHAAPAVTGTSAAVSVSAGGASSFSVTPATTTPTAGVPFNVTVSALDAYGNAAVSYSGSKGLDFSGPHTAPDGTHTPTWAGSNVARTFAAGSVTISTTLYDAETVALGVADHATPTITGTSAGITVAAASAATLVLAAGAPTAGAADNATLTARDAYGNLATGYSGDRSLTFGGANAIGSFTPTVTSKTGAAISFGASTTITFAAGVSTVSGGANGAMKLYRAETASITATDGTIGNGTGLSLTVSPAAAASFTLGATATAPTAGAADNLAVTAKDAYGNTATSYTGDKSLTFSGASSIGAFAPSVSDKTGTAISFGSSTTITFAAGVSGVSGSSNGVLRAYKAETAAIVVTAAGPLSNGSGLSVNVAPAAAASMSVTGYPSPTVAGVSHTFTVTARDAYGNTATGYAGTVTFAAGNDAQAVVPANSALTAGSGTFSATFKTVAGGTKTLTATDTVSSSITGSQSGVSVSAAAASQLVFTTQPGGTLNGGSAFGTQPAVTVEDAFANPVTTDSGSVTLAITGGTGTAGATFSCITNPVTASSGVATFAGCKIDKVGSGYTLTATRAGLTSGVSSAFTVSAGPAATFSLSASATSITAAGATNLTITALDAGGNTATGYTGSHNLTFSGANASPLATKPTVTNGSGSAVAFGTATAITFTSGVAAVSGSSNGQAVLYKAETAAISATDGTVATSVTVSVTVGAGTASNLAWTSVSRTGTGVISSPCLFTCTITTFSNNQTVTASVSVTDAQGNIVTGLGTGHTVGVLAVAQSSGGAFTAPSAGAGPEALTIASAGNATSTATFSYKSGTGSWTTDSLTAAITGGTVYTSAMMGLNKN